MIIEHAQIFVTPGREEEFISVFPRARAVISQADGFAWAELTRGVESPSTFLLLVGWESLEAHTEGFRNSELFTQWRAVISPFFAAPPEVEHVVAVTGGVAPVA